MDASRVALITGAGSGVGREIAVGLAAAGLCVGLVGRTLSSLEATSAICQERGARTVVAPADVTDGAAVAAALATVESGCGPVDLLVNNAGRIEHEEVGFADADLAVFWSVIETNLRGPATLIRAVLPGMIDRGGGRIVNINSGFGYRSGDIYTGYAVSKGALARLTSMIAHQYADAGVVAFDVSPGLVHTDMTAAMPMWAGPETRWNSPEHVVRLMSAIADGRLDRLSGRFLHAIRDDADSLLAHTSEILAADARVVRLVAWGSDDPLGG